MILSTTSRSGCPGCRRSPECRSGRSLEFEAARSPQHQGWTIKPAFLFHQQLFLQPSQQKTKALVALYQMSYGTAARLTSLVGEPQNSYSPINGDENCHERTFIDHLHSLTSCIYHLVLPHSFLLQSCHHILYCVPLSVSVCVKSSRV